MFFYPFLPKFNTVLLLLIIDILGVKLRALTMLGEGSVTQVYPQLSLLIILRESLIILIIQATLKPMIPLPQSSK